MTTTFVLAILAAGCTLEEDGLDVNLIDRSRAGEVPSDFTLVDMNPASLTADESVSVSDQRGRVSAWYFGHST